MPNLPMQTKAWPQHATDLGVDKIVEMYNNGFAGAYRDDKARDSFRQYVYDTGGNPVGADVSQKYGLADSAAGKLVIPYMFITKLFPNSLPGPAQKRGDCVSHSTKNACLLTMSCEIIIGKPDEVTGLIEGPPDIPPEGILSGVLSSESVYWWRHHGGDGWSCPDAAEQVLKNSGCCWPRKNYTELGIDLTHYDSQLAGKWGSTPPPENVKALGVKHLIRTATELNSLEQIRDFLANGYGVSSCGSEGFANTRNEDGLSARSGSWAHAMAYIGVDDRDIIKQKYGEPLVLVLNSWAIWNSGPTRILGTNFDILQGSFWAKWSSVKSRYAVAFSGVNGWPPQKLPDYGTTAALAA